MARKIRKREGRSGTTGQRDRPELSSRDGAHTRLKVSVVFVLFVSVAGEVPGSAVLVFDVELINVEEGLPEGYMFIWNEDVSPDLFSEMDKDDNKLVEPSEVRGDPPLPWRFKKNKWSSVSVLTRFDHLTGTFSTRQSVSWYFPGI